MPAQRSEVDCQMTPLNDEEFLTAFEGATLANSDFRHPDHIRMTFLYLQRHGLEAGTARVVEGIKRFADAKGATGLYHDTLTRFWTALIDHVAKATGAADAEEAVRLWPALLERKLAERHWSPELLYGPGARSGWVDPDLRPIPFPHA
ncbi:MAG: hypothetical protein ACYDAY_06435 [Candidatus Dormibacteria bacterium]